MTSFPIDGTWADTSRPSLITDLIKRIAKLYAQWRTIAVLAHLDDRMLKDIGLTRSCIRGALASGSRR
jgi:uncharacterized protein YjiS (DUF1127 family)